MYIYIHIYNKFLPPKKSQTFTSSDSEYLIVIVDYFKYWPRDYVCCCVAVPVRRLPPLLPQPRGGLLHADAHPLHLGRLHPDSHAAGLPSGGGRRRAGGLRPGWVQQQQSRNNNNSFSYFFSRDVAFLFPGIPRNLRNDLLVAADSITNTMSSLVKELHSGESPPSFPLLALIFWIWICIFFTWWTNNVSEMWCFCFFKLTTWKRRPTWGTVGTEVRNFNIYYVYYVLCSQTIYSMPPKNFIHPWAIYTLCFYTFIQTLHALNML